MKYVIIGVLIWLKIICLSRPLALIGPYNSDNMNFLKEVNNWSSEDQWRLMTFVKQRRRSKAF